MNSFDIIFKHPTIKQIRFIKSSVVLNLISCFFVCLLVCFSALSKPPFFQNVLKASCPHIILSSIVHFLLLLNSFSDILQTIKIYSKCQYLSHSLPRSFIILKITLMILKEKKNYYCLQ